VLAGSAHGTRRAAVCGAGAGTTTISRVVWIWMENHSYSSIIGASGSTAYANSPYVNGVLVPGCGLATNYHNVTHPSLPNYLAATSGSTHGVTSDCSPSSCPQSSASIFSQVYGASHGWRGYDESMPSNCSKSSTSLYAPKHNPAVYYTKLTKCSTWDVPLGTTTSGAFEQAIHGGTLPAFSFVTPNLCDDTHNCSIKTGDSWLKTWVPIITAGPNYTSGDTAVFITWDEGSGGSTGENCLSSTTDQSCHIATLVLSPRVKPGTRSSTYFSHYSLLKTTEQLLHLSYLGHAGDSSTASMLTAFGL
jgi:phospholipase C